MTALSSGETYTYDENGNMIERLEDRLVYYQTFDAENRLVSVTVGGQTTQFVYDGDGNLVKKIKPDGSKTIYAAGGIYEVDKSSSGVITRTVTYYPAGGAMRVDNSMYYVLKDRLGSAYATTDTSGNPSTGSGQASWVKCGIAKHPRRRRKGVMPAVKRACLPAICSQTAFPP